MDYLPLVVLLVRVISIPFSGIAVYQYTGNAVMGVATSLVVWALMPMYKS